MSNTVTTSPADQPSPCSSDLLKPSDAARFLGVGLSCLRRWKRENTGPVCYVYGRRSTVYPRADLEDFMASRAVGGVATPSLGDVP